jgi:molybdopterin molybdotransferase
MIPIKEAKSIIHKHILLSGTETVLLKDAGHTILAQDIIATFPMPSFDNSAMDGFAVRAVDTKGTYQSLPVTLKMVGVSSAGSPGDITLGPGECAQWHRHHLELSHRSYIEHIHRGQE